MIRGDVGGKMKRTAHASVCSDCVAEIGGRGCGEISHVCVSKAMSVFLDTDL